MPRMLKRILIVLVAVVALALAAWLVLITQFPAERRRAIVQRQLAAMLARDVRFGAVRLSLLPPVRLTVDEPALAEAGGFGVGAVFRARALHLDLAPWPLLRRQVVVRRLALEGPELHVVLRADGTTNLDGIGRPPRAAPTPSQRPMSLDVRDFTIRDGRVLLDDLAAARRVAFAIGTGTALEVAGAGRIATHGATTVRDLAFGPTSAARMSDLDRSLGNLDWTLEHRGAFDPAQHRLALETLALRFGGTRLALAGVVQDPGLHATVDLRARGQGVDLGQILSFLGKADARALRGLHGGGALDFDLGIRGALGAVGGRAARLPALSGAARVAHGWFQYAGAPAKVEELSFTARLAPDSLGIPDLAARVAGQPLRGRLTARRFEDPYVTFAIAGNVDLAAVAPLVAPPGGEIAGRAAVDVRGVGRAKDPAAMAIEGRAQLSQVRVKQPSLPKEIHDLSGTLEFSQTRARVSNLVGQAGVSRFALDATLDRPLALMANARAPRAPAPAAMAFTFRAPVLDLADVMPHGGGGIVLPNAAGGGTVSIGRMIDRKLELSQLAANLKLSPTALEVPSFRANVYDGLASGSAKLDLADTTRPRLAVRAQLDSARVEKLLTTWAPPDGWLDGGLGTHLTLDTELDQLTRTLTAAGLATVVNGSLGHLPMFDRLATFAHVPAFRTVKFRDLTSSFRIDHGRVFTGPATLHGPQGDWTLGGSVGLDGSLDYAVSVTVPPALVQSLGARAAIAAGALADDQGRVLMDFRVTGTARDPRVAWDPTAMRSRLAGRVSAAIEEQKKKYEQVVRDSVAHTARAAQDSARAAAERYRRAVQDSLARKGRDLLHGFFGGGRDTSSKH